jgi:hypothetical protein
MPRRCSARRSAVCIDGSSSTSSTFMGGTIQH